MPASTTSDPIRIEYYKPAAFVLRRDSTLPQSVGNQRQLAMGTTHTFSAMARFPLQGHSLRGELIEREGLLIYEGMTLSINPEGGYRVHFRTTTPKLPATLRLQFACKLNDADWHTLTLPPIKVRSEDERAQSLRHGVSSWSESSSFRSELVADGDSQAFWLEGYFPALAATAGASKLSEVRRDGSVRFGYDRAQTAVNYVP